MSQSADNSQKTLDLDFTVNLMTFSSNIHNNFKTIWEIMQSHSSQIDTLKKKLEETDERSRQIGGNEMMTKNDSQHISLVYSDKSLKSIKMNPEARLNDEGEGEGPIDDECNDETKPNGNTEEKGNLLQETIEGTGMKNTKQYNNELSLIESKIFEMNERLEKIELSSIKQSGNNSRKLSLLQGEIDRNLQLLRKRENEIKKIEHDVADFKTQLSGYKLKKESQLMRMSASSTGMGKNGDSNNYLLEKVQDLTVHAQQSITRDEFDTLQEQVGKQMDKINKKINSTVSMEEFNEIIAVLSKQIKKAKATPIFNLNQNQNKGQEESKGQGEGQEEEEAANEGGLELLMKIKEIEKDMQELQQKNLEEMEKRSNSQKSINQKINENYKEIVELKVQLSKNEYQIGQNQDFMKEMTSQYNNKFKENQEQIIEAQESIEKLNNQIKFYNFTGNSQTASSIINNGSNGSLATEQGKMSGIETDIINLKKKIGKYSLKIQGLKDDINTMKEDFLREIDGIKSQMQKKSDWESLKKGFAYFEEKNKEIFTEIMIIQESVNPMEGNEESTAAKKGWSCLCCDKDIKKFQGKLSQAKFTSIFPARYDSPRIGGYYKNRESQKDYKNLYLPKANSRRLSHGYSNSNNNNNNNNHNNKSREEL